MGKHDPEKRREYLRKRKVKQNMQKRDMMEKPIKMPPPLCDEGTDHVDSEISSLTTNGIHSKYPPFVDT